MSQKCDYTDKNCSSLDSACTIGMCDANTGDCYAAPSNEGKSCSNPDLFCKTNTVCQKDGSCAGGVDRDCAAEVKPGKCEQASCNEVENK